MKRFLLNVLMGLSTAACIGLCVLYVISDRFTFDAAVQNSARTWYRIESQTGVVILERQIPKGTFDGSKTPLGWPPPLLHGVLISWHWVDSTEELMRPLVVEPGFAGFGARLDGTTAYPPMGKGEWHQFSEISVPLWFLAVPFAMLPAVRACRIGASWIRRTRWASRAASSLFKASSVASLLLIPLLGVLWIRSYHVADRLRWVSVADYGLYWIRREWILETGLGGIGYYTDWDPGPGSAPKVLDERDLEKKAHPYESRNFVRYPSLLDPHGYAGGFPWRRREPIAGFYLQDVQGGGLLWMRQVTVPIWSLILLCGIAPAIWIVAWRRGRRILDGHCKVCGYDLRATPDRCPECGTVSDKRGADLQTS